MSKRINLNPKVLQKRTSKGHENEIIIVMFFIFLILLFFFGVYQYISYRNLMEQKKSLQIETQGLNFQKNNTELSKKIAEKDKEIKFMSGLKSNTNYYSEIYNIEKYEPKGITIDSINADKNGVNITAIASDSSLVPVFLNNLKESKEYSGAFLNNMQNVKVPESNKENSRSIQSKEKSGNEQNKEETSSNIQEAKSINETVFTIQIGGNTNESNGAS